MGKRDEELALFREFIEKARESYLVAHLPPLHRVYDSKEDYFQTAEEIYWSKARSTLLQHGIDVKYLVGAFLDELKKNHGSKRAKRLKEYMEDWQVRQYSHYMQAEIKADARRLWYILLEYRNFKG